MATIAVPLAGAGDLFRKLGSRVPDVINRGLLSASRQALPILVRQTDLAVPASANGSRGAVNTGAYRQAWKAEPKQGFLSFRYGLLVSNRMPYSGVIEYGRRRGARPPPTEAIARWAQRKLGLPYKKARGIAFVIAKKIGKRGLQPRRVLTSRTTLDLLKDALQRDMLHELIRALGSP